VTLSDLIAQWRGRQDEWSRLGAALDGAKVAAEIVGDLEALRRAQSSAAVTLREASLIGGYSLDHLQRLVACGQLENLGRKGRPRIRRDDVPVKPGHNLRGNADPSQLDPRRRIVASVAIRNTEES
jgi:hypothetical protein